MLMDRFTLFLRTTALMMLMTAAMSTEAHVIEVNGIYYDCPGPSLLRVTTNDGQYNSYSGDVKIPGYVMHNEHRYKVTSIDTCAFRGCTALTSVTIGDHVTAIGEQAFRDCPQLRRVNIPEYVSVIAPYTFAGCAALDSIVLPTAMTTIGEHAFEGCSSLSTISLPSSINSIGVYAFKGSGLQTLSLPGSVKTVSDYAFSECTSLSEVNIHDAITHIGTNAFNGCSGMKKLVLGRSLSTISKGAFTRCYALEAVTCKAPTPPTASSEIFGSGTYSNATLYVNPLAIADYSQAAYWRKFKHIENVPYDFEYQGIYYARIGLYGVNVGVSYKDTDYNSYRGEISIPRGFPLEGSSWQVRSIVNDAFRDCDSLTSVTIPSSSITSIGDRAFLNCPRLQSLSIPESVTSIGRRAFAGCKSLTDITLPSGLQVINDSTFQGCTSLTSITLPNGTKQLGADVFNGCTALEVISLSPTMAKFTVDERTLNGCTSLRSINCPTIMPPLVIGDCFSEEQLRQVTLYVQPSSLQDYQLDPFWGRFLHIETWDYDFSSNGIYYLITSPTEVAVSHHAPSGGSYTASAISIPDKVVYAGDQYTVTAIGEGAFLNCSSVTSVTMPPTITTIGEQAFKNCGLKGITIPSKVSVIDKQAFMGCSRITSLTIPNTIYAIEDSAFYGCSGVKTLDLGTSVTFVSNYAFASCSSLQDIFIPKSVTALCAGAFQDCSMLQDVMLDKDTKNLSVDGGVFMGCVNLATITSLAITPPALDNQHGGFEPTTLQRVTLLVPHSSVDGYRAAEAWGDFANISPLPFDFFVDGIYYLIKEDRTASVTSNGPTKLPPYSGNIDIPVSVRLHNERMDVTSIEPRAFINCNSVRSVNIPEGVTEIGEYAFSGSSIYHITLPVGITEIKDYTFTSCSNLSQVTIPEGVTAIGQTAFGMCPSLHEAILPSTLKTIGDGAFFTAGFYAGYFNVNLPNSLISIGAEAFMGSAVREVTLPSSIDSIAMQTFAMCGKLQRVNIPSSVKKIGPMAFYANNALRSVDIPNSVKDIDYGAFLWCEQLDTVTIGSGIERIDEDAFAKNNLEYWEEFLEQLEQVDDTDMPFDISWFIETWKNLMDELWEQTRPIISLTCTAPTPPATHTDAFIGSYNTAMVSVPQESLAQYKNATGWKRFVHINSVSSNDVNNDGEVNNADVNTLIDAITSDTEYTPRLDANNDDEISIADVNAILNEILYGNH